MEPRSPIQDILKEKENILSVLKDYGQEIAHIVHYQKVSNRNLRQVLSEKSHLEVEVQAIGIEHKNMKEKYDTLAVRNEGLRCSEYHLKSEIQTCKNELIAHEKQYNALKNHAESKLDKSNMEIDRLNKNYNK